MKKILLSGIAAIALSMGMTSCGDSFLETDYYRGVDAEGALNNADLLKAAVNGAYYNLFTRYFSGNYATMIGDIPTDLSYWNGQTGHWDDINQYTYDYTDTYLSYIWEYGYKVVDNTARAIQAGNELYANATGDDKVAIDLALGEAYALRAYANFQMVNVFGHQVKVNGKDFSAKPGLVISEDPIPAFTQVSRSTVGDTYAMIEKDLKEALKHFEAAGGDRGDKCYMNVAATNGLLARMYLYEENWEQAKAYAQKALEAGGVSTLTYTPEGYKALYNGGASNTESFFYLDINSTQNWSANSCGTLWTTYNFSPTPWLFSIYAPTDVRTAIMGMDLVNTTDAAPRYAGGKFSHYSSGNTAYATNYLINAPEMFLIIAEANYKLGNEADAKNALFVVAKRNTAIASADDLPSGADLFAFLKDERARELFQEGLRLYDLRRWDEKANVAAYGAPDIKFRYTGYNISELVYPIPADEINANFGVTQNEGWDAVMPK